MAPSKTPFLAIPDPKKSNLPHVCPDKIFLRCVVTILLFLKVAWDVRDMLDAKKCDWDCIKNLRDDFDFDFDLEFRDILFFYTVLANKNGPG